MTEGVFKVVELVGTSDESISKAINKAIGRLVQPFAISGGSSDADPWEHRRRGGGLLSGDLKLGSNWKIETNRG